MDGERGIWRILANRTVQIVTKITGTLSVMMMGVGLMISDSGHRPSKLWEILGFAGVTLAVLSIPPQTYYWYMRLRPSASRQGIDNGSLPNRSELSRWLERRRRPTR